MDVKKQMDQCMELCFTLQRQIEGNCQIPPGSLGGTMRYAYEGARLSQLGAVKEIYSRLRELEGRLDLGRKDIYR